MKITILGTGYVGLVTGTIFAELGNDVTCVDIDPKKIDLLKSGQSPIYEPGLEEIIVRNHQQKRLNFTTDVNEAVKGSQVIFIGVGTPSNPDGSVNLSYVTQAAEDIGRALDKIRNPKSEIRNNGSKILNTKYQILNTDNYVVIVNKSTVPIGTGDFVTKCIKKHYKGRFTVVSNPEFLREGQAVSDALHPDRVVIGTDSQTDPKEAKQAQTIMEKLYEPLDCPILFTDIKTAEMIKYASNAYLATSISFINQIAAFCEAVGADVNKVAEGMKLDKRIGKQAFLNAGAGYGGSCFPKDVKGIIDLAKRQKVILPVSIATEEVNKKMRQTVINKINKMVRSLKNKRVAVWGLAFKPQTDDIREAPALTILDYLIKSKAQVVAFDPVAQDNIAQVYSDIIFTQTPYEAAENADLIVLMTEWDEFSSLDLNRVKKGMKTPKMVDARNVYGHKKMKDLGFIYDNIGNVQ